MYGQFFLSESISMIIFVWYRSKLTPVGWFKTKKSNLKKIISDRFRSLCPPSSLYILLSSPYWDVVKGHWTSLILPQLRRSTISLTGHDLADIRLHYYSPLWYAIEVLLCTRNIFYKGHGKILTSLTFLLSLKNVP